MAPERVPVRIPWWQHILPIALLGGFAALMVYTLPLLVGDTYHAVRVYTSEAAQEARFEGRERRRLADEVAADRMTFEQAGCEYRGGDWDYAGHCAELEPPVHREHAPEAALSRGHLEGGNPRR